jgi:hypothetical protein
MIMMTCSLHPGREPRGQSGSGTACICDLVTDWTDRHTGRFVNESDLGLKMHGMESYRPLFHSLNLGTA